MTPEEITAFWIRRYLSDLSGDDAIYTPGELRAWCAKWTDEQIALVVPEQDREWVRSYRIYALAALRQLEEAHASEDSEGEAAHP